MIPLRDETELLPTHPFLGSGDDPASITNPVLGTGTADATTFLRGDRAWTTMSGAAPVASDVVTGTVKTDVLEADPKVYVKASVDTLLTGKSNVGHSHSGTDIVSGVVGLARGGTGADLSTFAQNKVFASPDGSSGSVAMRALVSADIPNLDTAKLTTGILANARGGTGADTSAAAANLIFGGPATGPAAAAALRALVAADIPNLDAAKIATGTLGTARLGSGVADATTFLRGDQTWVTAPLAVGPAGPTGATGAKGDTGPSPFCDPFQELPLTMQDDLRFHLQTTLANL